MLTYQEGNTLFIQHRFLKDLVKEILENPNEWPVEFEEKLKGANHEKRSIQNRRQGENHQF